MNDDLKAENLIKTGQAINAESWLLGDLEKRRIGETKEFHKNSSLENVTDGVMPNTWVSGFRFDDDGSEFAEIEIFELPKTKGQRRAIFIGMNIRMNLSEMPLIVDEGQKYLICKSPTAEQVMRAKQKMRGL
jgi:hypothetical protein